MTYAAIVNDKAFPVRETFEQIEDAIKYAENYPSPMWIAEIDCGRCLSRDTLASRAFGDGHTETDSSFTVYINDGYEDFISHFDTRDDASEWIESMTTESDDWHMYEPNKYEGTWETFDGETLKMEAEIVTS